MSVAGVTSSTVSNDFQAMGVALLLGNAGDAQAASHVLRQDLQSAMTIELVNDMANLSKAVLDIKV